MDRENIELSVRTINTVEYVVVEGPAGKKLHIQDWIRFPSLVCRTREEESIGASAVDALIRNSTIGDITGLPGRNCSKCFIVGNPDMVVPLGKNDLAIGVHAAVLSSHCSHAVVSDPDGKLLAPMRRKSDDDFPLGMLDAVSDYRLCAEWKRRAGAGCFRQAGRDFSFGVRVAPVLKTELFALDNCAGAMHAAQSIFGCWDIHLASADLSFADKRPGSVPVGDNRHMYPEHIWTLRYISAVAHIVLRNGGKVSYDSAAMAPLYGDIVAISA